MIYTSNLEDLVFSRHQNNSADELIIISGYIGPVPVSNLPNLGIKTTVVFGMYKERGVEAHLHASIESIDSQHNSILYSNKLVHSKCYVWKKNGTVSDVLVGSANFTLAGLNYDGKEILSEVSQKDFSIIHNYCSEIINNSISCRDKNILQFNAKNKSNSLISSIYGPICEINLYDEKTNQTQQGSVLNWGFQNGHGSSNKNDAYIPIHTGHIYNYPSLFPPKQTRPTIVTNNKKRHNDPIEVIWDDGYKMECLMEGTQTINGVVYPNKISSFSKKSELGKYLRQRLHVPLGQKVDIADLNNYGRKSIGVSLLAPGVYFFDFSV